MGVLTMIRHIRAGLEHVDHQIVPLAFGSYLGELPQQLETASDVAVGRAQWHHRSIAGSFEAIGGYRYAFQYPVEEVRNALKGAAQQWVRVFELRGTSPDPARYHIDTSLPEDDPRKYTLKPGYTEDSKEYSFTYPGNGLAAMLDAILSGDGTLVSQIAKLVGHPTDINNLDPQSDDCTPNHLHLSYALKAFLLGDNATAESEVRKIRLVRHILQIWHEAQMLRAITSNNCSAFLEGLEQVLSWHRKQARKDENRARPKLFMCIPALGLCRLALSKGVCTLSDLPQDNVFLPLELITDTEPKL